MNKIILSALLTLFLHGVFYGQTVNTLADNLTVLYAQNSSNFRPGDVLLKENAITVNGIPYDALFSIKGKAGSGVGLFELNANNPGSVNMRFAGAQTNRNPYVWYNLQMVEHGSATTTNLTGTPVAINNLKLALPDLDGTATYVDIAGYRTTGGTAPTVTVGANLTQQDFYNNPLGTNSITNTSDFIKYRTNAPASDVSDNFLPNFYSTGYSVRFDFSVFPESGIDLLFGVTYNPAETTGTTGNRTFFHVFTVDNTTTLPVTFGGISAVIDEGRLEVNWATLSETNNDHFEVEASADGKSFTTIGTTVSKAVNGHSGELLQYQFITTGNTLTLGAALGFLLLGIGFPKRRKIAGGLAGILVVAFVLNACSKKDISSTIGDSESVFVRIVQVDKDGGKSYSKTIKATKR